MKLEKLYIGFYPAEESRNIGAACRAMANTALSICYCWKKRRLAMNGSYSCHHAVNLWITGEFFPSITEAEKTAL